MSQYAYILVVLSLVFLFLLNKYEKERLQRLYQEQLLKDETFRSDIKEKIHTTENINDVIAHINKNLPSGNVALKRRHRSIEIIKIREAFFSDFLGLPYSPWRNFINACKVFCNFLYFFKIFLHFL